MTAKETPVNDAADDAVVEEELTADSVVAPIDVTDGEGADADATVDAADDVVDPATDTPAKAPKASKAKASKAEATSAIKADGSRVIARVQGSKVTTFVVDESTAPAKKKTAKDIVVGRVS